MLLISSLYPLNAVHCLTQSMFTLINHFKIFLFLTTFSAFKLSVGYGNVSNGFSNRFLVQQPFQYSPNAEILHVPQFFFLKNLVKPSPLMNLLLRFSENNAYDKQNKDFCFYCTQEMGVFLTDQYSMFYCSHVEIVGEI